NGCARRGRTSRSHTNRLGHKTAGEITWHGLRRRTATTAAEFLQAISDRDHRRRDRDHWNRRGREACVIRRFVKTRDPHTGEHRPAATATSGPDAAASAARGPAKNRRTDDQRRSAEGSAAER